MSHVNDEVRRERQERIARMTPAERTALARKLGEEGLAAFMAAHRMDRGAAQASIRRSRRVGRRRSPSADEER